MLWVILISRLTTWLIVVTVLISSPVSADKLAEYFQRYELIYSAGANRIIKQNCLDTYKNYINSLLPGRETFFNSKCVTQTSTDPVTDIPSGRIAYEFQNVSATENRLKVTFTVIIGPNGLTVSQYSECGRYLAVTVENRALSLMNIPALTQTCNNIIGTWTKPADFETNPQHQGFTCDATEKKTYINHVMYCYPVVPGYITSINPDFTGKQVTLSWIPSSGVVTYYNVVFDGGNGDTRTQTSFTNTIMMTSLTPGRRYNITITAISGSMTSDPRYGTTMTTATESISEYTGAVAGSSVTVAVLISVAILIVIIIKRRKNNLKDRKNCNYDDLQMGPYVNQGRVISKDKTYTSLTEQNKINRYKPRNLSNIYQILMEMHKDSDLVFAKEFQDLEILSEKGECKTAKLQINKKKNRNENILPFDNSCVKLTEEKNNYINASFLQNLGNHSGQDFIVTQHPLSNTIEDFWTMIWEQNVSVIVMLTPQNDDCKDSYATYFPSEPQSSKQYGSINIETMSKWLIQKTESSSLKLKKGKKSRVVKHFRSLGWNDKYDRTMQTELVQLIDAVKSNVNSSDKLIPTVVHCGLGTGRSGVFIALYQLMDCIHDNSVDIFDMVLTMRERRMQLIENECQYIFIHDCLLHMMNENKNEQAAFQDQSTGDTYEYIVVPCTIWVSTVLDV